MYSLPFRIFRNAGNGRKWCRRVMGLRSVDRQDAVMKRINHAGHAGRTQ